MQASYMNCSVCRSTSEKIVVMQSFFAFFMMLVVISFFDVG
jgi:hypothetical protein